SATKVNFTDSIGDKLTIYQKAYGEAINGLGNISIFDSCLNQLYHRFRMTCKENEGFQDSQRKPIKLEITKLSAEIVKREALLTIKDDKIDFYKNRINELDNDIDQVQVQPKKYG